MATFATPEGADTNNMRIIMSIRVAHPQFGIAIKLRIYLLQTLLFFCIYQCIYFFLATTNKNVFFYVARLYTTTARNSNEFLL
jgi:hypothetical protein